jgi:hypothetical protein
MLKVTYLSIVSSLLLLVSSYSYGSFEPVDGNSISGAACTEETLNKSNADESCSDLNPTFAEGYEDGFAEGKRLALIPNYQTYVSIRDSYRDYAANHPDYPQYFEHFRGKYLGIVEGWQANFVPAPSGGGLDVPGSTLCTDSNGLRRPCWSVALDNEE